MTGGGILLAITALFCWGFGDFLIEKTSRLVGTWKAVFFTSAIALPFMTIFVYRDLAILVAHPADLWLLVLASFVVVAVSIFDFRALQDGKIAIVEPVLAAELPLTVLLSVFLWHEHLSLGQGLLVAVIFIGIVLAAATKLEHLHYHKRLLEKGVIFAALGGITTALLNLLTGVASAEISPLVTIWFMWVAITLVTLAYLIYQRQAGALVRDLARDPKLIISLAFLDSGAWICFAFATTIISISIAAAISEGYIALAVLLGLFLNKEKLRPHQLAGAAVAVAGVICLAAITG